MNTRSAAPPRGRPTPDGPGGPAAADDRAGEGDQTAGIDQPAGQGRADRAGPAAPVPWRRDLLAAVGLLAFVLFALGSVGSPLWGGSVLAATDELATRSPYDQAGLSGTPVQNTFMDDTYDAVIPDTVLFTGQVREGRLAAWNPYVLGGVPLGAVTHLGLASPLTLPYYVLPAALAPGYVKLLETLVAGWLTVLFLRRLRLGRPAALFGALLFAGSAFLVVWTNWPHTRTAAFIPAVFWAAERLVQQRRARDAALLALAVAGMLAGGFPAVTAFTLYTAGPYLLVRALAEYPGQWRRVAGIGLRAAAAVAGGAALLAVQLLPFLTNLSGALVAGREQGTGDQLNPSSLVTALAPFAMGTVQSTRPPQWFLPVNLVESMAYVGAAGLVLAVVALAVPWAARAVLPRGGWSFLVAALGAWLVVLYTGPGAWLAHHLPVFSSNFVGRGRAVVGLLVAALAATGLEVLLRRRGTAPVDRRTRRLRVGYAVLAGLAPAAGLVVVYWAARRAAFTSRFEYAARLSRVQHLNSELLAAGVVLGVAGLAVAVLWWAAGRPAPAWRRIRFGAAATLPLLAAGQALAFTGAYYPRVDRDTFFPVTATHQYLLDHVAGERFTGSAGLGAMQVGADSLLRIRALDGHAFTDRRFAELVEALPGPQFGLPTVARIDPTGPVLTSPVLDRLAVRYFVVSLRAPVFGQRRPVPGDGRTVALPPGTPVTAPVPVTGPVRAVSLTPLGKLPPLPAGSALEVVLSDATGREVARSRRPLTGMEPGRAFDVPVAAEHAPAGRPLVARVTAVGTREPLRMAGTAAGTAAVSTLVGGGDGLRLAHAGPAVVYERLTALPRIRWASTAVPVPDQAQRLARLSGGTLRADQVVLDQAPGGPDAGPPPAAGRPAGLRVTEDGSDLVEVAVSAQGAGYLVLADAVAGQWRATVDGAPAPLVPADHGLAAVPVPAGEHTVRVRYTAPYHNLGGWISLLAVTGLVGIVTAGQIRDRRRRAARLSSPRPAHPRPAGDAGADARS